MDGLMLDTERLELDLYVEISRKMGWPTPQAMLRNTVGVGDTESAEFYKNQYGPDYPYQEIWNAVLEEETRYGNKNGLPLKKGIFVLLDKLKSLCIPAAIATSTKTPRMRWKLERAGILDRFSVFACGEEVENGKPAPDIFLLAAKKLGVEPRSCIGFEDSAAGLEGLSKAGIPSVFIKDLSEPPPEIRAVVWKQCLDLEEAALLFG
jgi:beta-phosphoglucomutase-like phosphatase (HAD superfamily)